MQKKTTVGAVAGGINAASNLPAPSSSGGLKSSSKSNPCPICGRSKDRDCRIGAEVVLCHHGSSHQPPQGQKPGDTITAADGAVWAFTGDTKDGRAATYTRHKPLEAHVSKTRSNPPAFELARLAEAKPEPPQHWENGQRLKYSDTQTVVVVANGREKKHIPHHTTLEGKEAKGAGPDPWPLRCEAEAIKYGSGKWIAEAEGEKCAQWFRAAGFVGVSQPGHDHKPASIERRYRALVLAGVVGVVYLADNDKTGTEKGERCRDAALAAGLGFRLVKASAVWDGISAGGSIDDAPGTASERAAQVVKAAKREKPARAKTVKTAPARTFEQGTAPAPVTFEDRWKELEEHAAVVACSDWPVMKAVASLASKAGDLDVNRLTGRNLEQLLEQAHRAVRAKADPIAGGGTYKVKTTPWAVDGLFRHGLNLLVGQSGAGKSRLAAACMAAWLRGDQTWLNLPLNGIEPEHRHALIVGSDQTLEDWAITLEPVGLCKQLDAETVQIHPNLTLYGLETAVGLDADGLAMIRRWVDHHPGGMVLVDSLSSCLPPGIDEATKAAGRPVRQLQEVLGDAWGILTHHTRKGAGKEGNLGVGAGRGSGDIDAAASRVIGLGLIYKMENGVLVPQESDDRRELLSTKRGGKTLHLVVRSDASGFWSNEGDAEALKRQERQERAISNLTEPQGDVLALLDVADGWMTLRALMEGAGEEYEARGSKAATMRKMLKRLEVLGLVESVKTGSERTYRAKGEPLRGEERELTGSLGSPTAPQGVSMAHPLAHTGSHGPGEPPTGDEPLGEPPTGSEPQGEPQGEPVKTQSPQQVSQVSHLPPLVVHPTGSPPTPPNWPAWGDQLLQLRAEHPDLIPAQLVNLLQAEHGITTTGRTVAQLLSDWDAMQEPDAAA